MHLDCQLIDNDVLLFEKKTRKTNSFEAKYSKYGICNSTALVFALHITHLRLCLVDAIHNLSEWKLFRFYKMQVNFFLKFIADLCHFIFSTCLKADMQYANKKC